jgi:hypothetical protein
MNYPARQPRDRLNDVDSIVAEARLAVREALAEHRLAGNPVAVWRDGKVVWIPPEEIPVEATVSPTDSPARRR